MNEYKCRYCGATVHRDDHTCTFTQQPEKEPT